MKDLKNFITERHDDYTSNDVVAYIIKNGKKEGNEYVLDVSEYEVETESPEDGETVTFKTLKCEKGNEWFEFEAEGDDSSWESDSDELNSEDLYNLMHAFK